MESFTHESDDSSSCTQSDGDSTNSSNGTNPFLLCPRGDSLHLGGHGRLHAGAGNSRPYKLARLEPSHYHASNPQGLTTMPYAHNVMGEICGPEGVHRSALLSRGRSYTSSVLEDCRDHLPPEFSSASRLQHGALPYIGAGQNFFPHDQWLSMRQQNYFLKPVTTSNAPASTLLWPMSCKEDKMPINFGNNAGNFYMGLTDPQPGRCRRTDGKKWRCGRAVVPEQKYCERHMHRGRGRSKAAKLAKVTTAVDANQPHGLGRPLNQPLIQLLNQLNVPVQSVNQTPEGGQQPTGAIQPLNWLQKSAQLSEYPHTNLPYLGQPVLAEQLSQFSIQSKSLDWPLNQSPMQAEPLNLGQSNGRPPVLAHAIPINAVSEVKISPDRGTELANTEASRMHSDDPNDVLNLDVQGIKWLLENAPCSRRSTSFLNKPKQLPNVANLSNVAHIDNSNIEPRKPPSLMDVLKIVDPFTSSSMGASTSSVFHNHPPSTVQVSVNLPINMCQPPQKIGQSGTHLSLTWTDDQTPEKQNKRCSSPSSLDQVTKQIHDGGMPLKLSKAMHEGWLNTRTSETTNGRQPELLLQGSKKSEGALVKLEKACLNLMEEKSQSSGHSIKGVLRMEDGDSKSAAGSNCPKNSASVDIGSFAQAGGGFSKSRSLEAQESSLSLRNVTSNCHEASPKSNSGSIILLEGSLDVCESSGKSEGFISNTTEKIVVQHVGAQNSDVNCMVLSKKRVNPRESYASLDMNLPILVVKTECQLGNSELRMASPSSTTPMENLQTKAALDSSSSGSSCNASSLSKSTLSLDPAAVSNLEPSSHVSLAN